MCPMTIPNSNKLITLVFTIFERREARNDKKKTISIERERERAHWKYNFTYYYL